MDTVKNDWAFCISAGQGYLYGPGIWIPITPPQGNALAHNISEHYITNAERLVDELNTSGIRQEGLIHTIRQHCLPTGYISKDDRNVIADLDHNRYFRTSGEVLSQTICNS